MSTSNPEPELDPLWEDLDWAMGQMLIMGWDGTEVTPQIRNLIEEHHLGSIMLTAKNLKSAHETAKLVQELQTIAHKAGHPHPLLIAIDQENGGVNSLFDEDYICQFPSAMGIAAAGNSDLSYAIAKATATEVSACGVNLMLGPVLDVLTNARYQPLGVRATSDDPQEVSQYSAAAMKGYKDAGLATCGKHFPSYGNLDFLGSSLNIPIITQSLEEMSLGALVPFRNAIATGHLDAMLVGGCGIANPSMNVSHACLSDQVVDDLLRNELGFQGVAISECLEMEALGHEIGVKGGTVMAVEAGCDIVMLCRAYDVQLEAIAGLKLGYANGIVTRDRIYTSLRRVLNVKRGCTSWAKALNPPGLSLLSQIHPTHLALSRRAYDDSITVMHDRDNLLPLSQTMHQHEELLLLTPLVKPLPASSAKKTVDNNSNPPKVGQTGENQSVHDKWLHRDRVAIMSGEGVFRNLGRSLARARHGKLLHTSYTANGVRPVHENLIHRTSTIIIVTADANRNLYQAGFTKHVAMMCSMLRSTGQKKNLIVVAVSSPYDFAMDKTIGTYICTFDFTEMAMNALVRVLYGEFAPCGTLPGTLRKSKKVLKSRRNWLVETYSRDRDAHGLDELLKAVARGSNSPQLQCLRNNNNNRITSASFEVADSSVEAVHLVVRNSSTQALYGFCATYFAFGVGIIGGIFVDPAKRNISVGRSLHRGALRLLSQKPNIVEIQLGCGFPGLFPGILAESSDDTSADVSNETRSWFTRGGWDLSSRRHVVNMAIQDLTQWTPPEGLTSRLASAGVSFDLIQGPSDLADSVLTHVLRLATPEIVALYQFALHDNKKTCAVVRAKMAASSDDNTSNSNNEMLMGTVVVCTPDSPLSKYLPALQWFRSPSLGGDNPLDNNNIESTGGIVAPIVLPSTPHTATIYQGLAMMGVRQNKNHRAVHTVLSLVVGDPAYEAMLAMQFGVLQVFDQITNKPNNKYGGEMRV